MNATIDMMDSTMYIPDGIWDEETQLANIQMAELEKVVNAKALSSLDYNHCTLPDSWSTRGCNCVNPCPLFVEYASMEEYVDEISDIEIMWFEHKCTDVTKVTWADWVARRFFNHSAYVHWLKWRDTLEKEIRLLKITEGRGCAITWEQEMVQGSNSFASYLTRSATTCLPRRQQMEMEWPMRGYYRHHDGLMIAHDSPDAVLFTSKAVSRTLDDGGSCYLPVPVAPLSMTQHDAAYIYNYLDKLLPRRPGFMLLEGKPAFRSVSGIITFPVAIPSPSIANLRLATRFLPSLFPLIIPFTHTASQVFDAHIGNMTLRARGYDFPVSLGVVEGEWLLVREDREIHGMRIEYERQCTCYTDRFDDGPSETYCLKHGVTAKWNMLTIQLGRYSRPCDIWCTWNWPHLIYSATLKKSDYIPIGSTVIKAEGQNLWPAYVNSPLGVFNGWANPVIAFGFGEAYVVSLYKVTFALRFERKNIYISSFDSLPEPTGLPIDLLIALLVRVPEPSVACFIFFLVHHYERFIRAPPSLPQEGQYYDGIRFNYQVAVPRGVVYDCIRL